MRSRCLVTLVAMITAEAKRMVILITMVKLVINGWLLRSFVRAVVKVMALLTSRRGPQLV